VRFDIPGPPIPQKRPRFSMKGNRPVVFNPNASDKRIIQALMKKRLGSALNSQDKASAMEALSLSGAKSYKVIVFFWFEMPKSWSKKKALISVNAFHACKPDIDNLIKFYLDCATGVIWQDDRFVSEITAVKRYGLKPGTTMIITAQNVTEIDCVEACVDYGITYGYEQLNLFE
jgi:Holliday junction resolvase RusA-like endonuclease